MAKTLLLADDSVTMQKVVGITFANEDIQLVTVDNGDAALDRARQIRPDIVLADIGMPGLSGYELCHAIKSDPALGHVRVILLTGTFDTYDEARAREVGADAHVAKPFEAQALVDQVRALLRSAPRPPGESPPPAPARGPASTLPPSLGAEPRLRSDGPPQTAPGSRGHIPVPPPRGDAAPRPGARPGSAEVRRAPPPPPPLDADLLGTDAGGLEGVDLDKLDLDDLDFAAEDFPAPVRTAPSASGPLGSARLTPPPAAPARTAPSQSPPSHSSHGRVAQSDAVDAHAPMSHSQVSSTGHGRAGQAAPVAGRPAAGGTPEAFAPPRPAAAGARPTEPLARAGAPARPAAASAHMQTTLMPALGSRDRTDVLDHASLAGPSRETAAAPPVLDAETSGIFGDADLVDAGDGEPLDDGALAPGADLHGQGSPFAETVLESFDALGPGPAASGASRWDDAIRFDEGPPERRLRAAAPAQWEHGETDEPQTPRCAAEPGELQPEEDESSGLDARRRGAAPAPALRHDAAPPLGRDGAGRLAPPPSRAARAPLDFELDAGGPLERTPLRTARGSELELDDAALERSARGGVSAADVGSLEELPELEALPDLSPAPDIDVELAPEDALYFEGDGGGPHDVAPPRDLAPPRGERSSDRAGPREAALDRELVRQALEKVAWEAFGPLSETLVKDIVRKVEEIAWETIPQLAERLIREELERLRRD
jgi:CheY-like chemotaxis protein